MRRRLAVSTLVLVAVIAQLSLVTRLRILGVAPDVVVVVIAAIAVRCGSETGAVTGFIAGLLIDLFLPTPAGLTALAYTLVGYGFGRAGAGVLEQAWWTGPAAGAVAAFAAGSLYAVVGGLFGEAQLLRMHVMLIVPIAAGLSGAVALVLFPFVRSVVPVPRSSRMEPLW